MSDEFTLQRLHRDSATLEQYEATLLETAAGLKLYRQQHGHEPPSIEALNAWIDATQAKPIDPYSVLSREEIAQLWEDAEY